MYCRNIEKLTLPINYTSLLCRKAYYDRCAVAALAITRISRILLTNINTYTCVVRSLSLLECNICMGTGWLALTLISRKMIWIIKIVPKIYLLRFHRLFECKKEPWLGCTSINNCQPINKYNRYYLLNQIKKC